MRKINGQSLLEDRVAGLILRLAVPMIIAFAFQTSYNFLDRLFVSRLGDLAMAALGMAFTVQLFLIALGSGIGVGINSFIARNLGAGRQDRAVSTAWHAFLMAVILGISVTILGLLVQQQLFEAMGAQGLLLHYILNYLTIIFFFTPVILLGMFLNNVFRGWGDTVRPMIFMLTGTIGNIILDPLLIFGLGPFPRLGVRGAALATGISRSLAVLLALGVIFIRKRPVHFPLRAFQPSWRIVRGIFQVGLPSSVSQFLSSMAMGIIFFLLRPFGAAAKAAYTIVFTYEMVAFLPVLGVAQAVTILTGHNFGASHLQRVGQILWRGIWISLLIMVCLAVGIATSPRLFASVFARSPEVLAISAHALRITVFGYIFYSFYLTSIASFQGLGLGRQYLLANMVRLYAFQIPFVYVGRLLLHLDGVWFGLLAGNFISSLLVLWWYWHIFKNRILTGEVVAISP